jgi:hypothetical protein
MSGSHAQRLGEDVALGAGAVLVGRIELEPILQGSATRGVEAAAQPAEHVDYVPKLVTTPHIEMSAVLLVT